MIKYEYTASGCHIRHLYFLNKIDKEMFEQEMKTCDELTIFYADEIDSRIFSKYGSSLIYFSKGASYSIMVDISKSESDIINGFHKNRKYEVRRALERDCFDTEIILNPDIEKLEEARIFYNIFAKEKGLPDFVIERYDAASKFGCFALASIRDEDGALLVQNGYFLDNDKKIVTFTFGASHFREDNRSALIGRANGCLHYKCMIFFKKLGYIGYDLGGFYVGNDKELTNISDYKRRFGGEIKEYAPCFICQKKDYEFVEFNISKLKEIVKKKNIIIYGMGSWGKYIISRIYELYQVKPVCLIDNFVKPTDDYDIKKADVLRNYTPNKHFLIVATRKEQYKEISEDELVKPFIQADSILCIREEKI